MRKRSFYYLCLIAMLEILLLAAALLLARYVPAFQTAQMERPLTYAGLVVLAALALALFAAWWLSRRLIRPLEDPAFGGQTYDELSPLLHELELRRSQVRSGAGELERKEADLQMIIQNMSEGLVIMDGTGVIITLNPAARELLAAEGDGVGKHLFALNRDPGLQAAVHMAIGGTSDESRIHIAQRMIHAIANPVIMDSEVKGVVLFLLDVTREYAAEQMRREFSANVSHELKTPLTAISGYAEIIQNGMVAPQDVPRFAGSIYQEAQRLIALVNDIIRLSRLDEGVLDGSKEEIDMMQLARSVAARLRQKAQSRQVCLEVSGEGFTARGEESLLEEMLYNLCDNGITYNRPEGKVEVILERSPAGNRVTVRDNGIGIPKEHQSRVFERFYRVDKSHSKEIGGTGLGLSIVKHVAMIHHLELKLESAPGKGTTITLQFPVEEKSGKESDQE